MIRPVKVEALPKYRLQITYADGVRGVIDLYEAVRDNFNLQLIERQEINDWRPHPWTLYKVASR